LSYIHAARVHGHVVHTHSVVPAVIAVRRSVSKHQTSPLVNIINDAATSQFCLPVEVTSRVTSSVTLPRWRMSLFLRCRQQRPANMAMSRRLITPSTFGDATGTVTLQQR